MRILCVCGRTLKWGTWIKFIDYINYVVQQQDEAERKKRVRWKMVAKYSSR